MQNSFRWHKYWIVAAVLLISATVILYRYSTLSRLEMKITRAEAVDIAREFLAKQNVDLNGYLSEVFIDNDPVRSRYLLYALRRDGFSRTVRNEEQPVYGWDVLFYRNLTKNTPQTIYRLSVSQSGRITEYHRNIPDTMFLPSITRDSAAKFITGYLQKNRVADLSGYKLIESKEDNHAKRNDFTFLWEKNLEGLEAKMRFSAQVQGNQPGSFQYILDVPESHRNFIDTSEAILGTVSVIFIVFFMQYAVILFLKKYHQGEIWMKIGRRLFIIYLTAMLIGVVNDWPAYGNSIQIGDLGFLTVKIISVLTSGLLLSFFLSILLFVTWTVGESNAREIWPGRFKSVDAFIKGRLFSLPSGIALFKGMVLGTALALVYLLKDVVLNGMHTPLFMNITSGLSFYGSFAPVIRIVTESFSTAAFTSIALTFFVVNVVYQRWKKKWLAIFISGIITTLGMILTADTGGTGITWLNIVMQVFYGCLFAWLYLAFDLLTLSSTLFYYLILTGGFVLAASDAGYYKLNFVLLALIYISAPVIFVVSILRKEDFVLENFGLPTHILRISERERLKKEMEIAARMQLSLLPKEQPLIPGYDIAGTSIPAKEAGGDYYDFIKLANSRLGIAIGDVSGKGVGAAIYMTLTKGIFQAHAEENVSPKQVLGKVNQLLYKTIEKNSFVSMIYSILDFENHKMIYSRAGQNPGIFCSDQGGGTKYLTSNGIALGLDPGPIFNRVLIEEEVNICHDDVVVFYTDGFTEAMNERREEYGEERLMKIIQENKNKPAGEIINHILKDIKTFVDVYPQHDDMTIVIIKRS